MQILYFLIPGAVITLLLYAREADIPVKEKIFLQPFIRAGYKITELYLRVKRGRKGKTCTVGELKYASVIPQLACDYHSDECIKIYYSEKLALLLLILLLGSLAAIFLEINGEINMKKEEQSIVRNSYGEGEHQEVWYFSVEGLDEKQPLVIQVRERDYSQEEALRLMEEAKEQLEDIICGENPSLLKVREDLYFPSRYLSTPILLYWTTDNYAVIDHTGKISNDQLPEEGIWVDIDVQMTYQDLEDSFQTAVCVLPKQLSFTERIQREIEIELEQRQLITKEEETFELPQMVEGEEILWEKEKENLAFPVFFLTLTAAICIYSGKDKELQKKYEARKRQMFVDYGDILSKLILYIKAGLTVPKAFRKVALDYEKREYSEIRYAYEEMRITCFEMDGGIPVQNALEDFGTRCQEAKYMKLSLLLVQSLKKGSAELAASLESEMQSAFEERKNAAKRAGEEAGTKLLAPMCLMMLIVFIILLVPAFLSIQL